MSTVLNASEQSILKFEEFLFNHDSKKFDGRVTHTNMRGGSTTHREFTNSGTYYVDDESQLKELLINLPKNYLHGLSCYLKDKFRFFVDLDMAVAKQPRPTLSQLSEWGVETAKLLQQSLSDSILNLETPYYIVVSVISARQNKKGLKAGVHLHVPDLIVDKTIATALCRDFSAKIEFPQTFKLLIEEREKLVDLNLYQADKPALRMYNACKFQESAKYHIHAILDASGNVKTELSLRPEEEYELTSTSAEQETDISALLALFGSSKDMKRSEHPDADDLDEQPAKRIQLSDESFSSIIKDKIQLHFPQAKVTKVVRQNGTVWLAKLNSKYCWIKKGEHDSASAFLTITRNGIQAKCSSTYCQLKATVHRIPCFNAEESALCFSSQHQNNDEYALGVGQPEDSVTEQVVAEYNQRFAYVMVGESYCNLQVVERRSIDPLTGSPNVRFMNPKVFLEWHRDERTADGRSKAEIWMHSSKQCRYKNIVFMPGVDTEEKGWFNMWQGFQWTLYEDWLQLPNPSETAYYMNDPDMGEVLHFIYETISASKQDTFDYVLNWLAFAVQHPDKPGEVTLALRGARGIGKTFFGIIASRLFGIYGKVIEAKQLAADFNGCLRNVILLVADEASGQHDVEMMVRLQHIATSEYLDINQKNIEKFRVKNCLHIIICSNLARMVSAGRDGRRYCVLDVAPCHKKDVVYFARLSGLLTDTFFQKFLTMLTLRDIRAWVKTDWPLTSQKPLWENKQVSLTATEHWLYAKLREATEETWRLYLSKDVVIKEVSELDNTRKSVPKQILIEQELNAVLAPHQVCSTESGLGLPTTNIAGKKRPAYRFPSLTSARESFASYVETSPIILWP